MSAAVAEQVKRKALGAYYTPDTLSELLCRWAVRSGADYVLEPSFGGCSFLTASFQRLANLDSKSPAEQVFGFDVDADAFEHLAALAYGYNAAHFLKKDFLCSDKTDFDSLKFTAIVGNPPFVAPSAMSQKQRESANKTMSQWQLSGKHSLWSLFVAHSLNHLAIGGRMAWVVPSSIEFTNYGTQLLDMIAKRFESVRVTSVATRQFSDQGTSQKIAILLAEEFCDEAVGSLHQAHVRSLSVISELPVKPSTLNVGVHDKASFEVCCKNLNASPFSKYGSVSVGIVTGNTKFFTMTATKAKELRLSKSCLKPIVQRGSTVSGVRWTEQDQTQYLCSDKPALMLSTSSIRRIGKRLSMYLDSLPIKDRKSAYLSRRRTWHQVVIGDPCDAFLVFMNKYGPRLVSNESSAICSNSMHRVSYKAETTENTRAFLPILMVSSWGRLWAELHGRNYSHSTIKVEPGDVAKFPVPKLSGIELKTSNEILAAIDNEYRNGQRASAESIANQFIKETLFPTNEDVWELMVSSASALRARRLGEQCHGQK